MRGDLNSSSYVRGPLCLQRITGALSCVSLHTHNRLSLSCFIVLDIILQQHLKRPRHNFKIPFSQINIRSPLATQQTLCDVIHEMDHLEKTLSDFGPSVLMLPECEKYVPLVLTKTRYCCPLTPRWKHNWAAFMCVCVCRVHVMVCAFVLCAVSICVPVLSERALVCHRLSNFFLTLNYHKHTSIYTRYTGNFQQCKQPCVVDVWDWLREKQSCLKSHLGWEAAHMESYQIVLILLIGCSTLNRSSC